MSCGRCGSLAVDIVDSSGGTSGPFTEQWECAHCGATGTISGDAAEPPTAWTRFGGVFDR